MVEKKKGMGAAAISMSNNFGRGLMVVPIWIALSSTVILYNSKSAVAPQELEVADMFRISVHKSRFPICESSLLRQTSSFAE